MKSKPPSIHSLLVAFVLVLCVLPTGVLGRAVLGIDLGSTNVRMGMLRSGVGSVEVVLSFESDRKTIAAVGYRDGQTLFSQTAMNMFPMFPKNIFCRLNSLLGKVFNSEAVKGYTSAFTHQLAADPNRGTVLMEEPVHKKLVPVEQFTATFFAHLLEQAEKHAGFPVVDCVIAVPAYFGQWERQAVLDAAKIAGFNVLSLINGSSSAAFFKITTANDLNEASNFIIFDSGAGGTSATLALLDPKREVDGVSGRAMEVKAVAGEAGLGGDLIDDRIAGFLRQKFEAANPGIRVTSGKPYNKVLVEAARIKRILNTNDHVSVSLEDLVEEYSLLISRLQREDVDALLVDLADRFVAPIKKVLADAGMNDLSAVHSILMIGGNSRHQFVLKSLKAAFGGEKLSVTLDPDEAIVKGATLFAAKLHPAFRLRPVQFTDVAPEALAVEYSKLPEGASVEGDLFTLPWADDRKSIDLFPAKSHLTSRKSLTLKHHDSLLAELKDVQGGILARFAVSGFDAAVASIISKERTLVAAKLRIPVQITLSGQALIEPAVAVIEYEEKIATGEVQETGETGEMKDETDGQTKSNEQASAEEKTDKSVKDAKEQESKPAQQATKKFVKTVPLKHHVQYRVPPMTAEAIQAARAMIDEAKAEELKKLALETARNDLEHLVYHWQGEVSAAWFLEFGNKNEKAQMPKIVSKASSLLNDKKVLDQEDPAPYQKALEEIKAIESAVKSRQAEFEGRPAAVEALQGTLAAVHEFLTAQQPIPPEERAVSDAELNDLKAELSTAEKWLNDALKKQSALAKHDQPALLIVDIQKRATDLKKFLTKLKAKKKPVKPVAPVEPVEPVEPVVEGEEAKAEQAEQVVQAEAQSDDATQDSQPVQQKEQEPIEHDEL